MPINADSGDKYKKVLFIIADLMLCFIYTHIFLQSQQALGNEKKIETNFTSLEITFKVYLCMWEYTDNECKYSKFWGFKWI